MVTIPSGSFFLSNYIQNKIELNNVTEAEISFAIKKRIRSAIKYRFSKTDKGSNEWFFHAKYLAKTDKYIAYRLGSLYQAEQNFEQAIFWYKKAMSLNYKKANSALADVYIETEQLLLAKNILIELTSDVFHLNQLVTLAITLGDLNLLNQLFTANKERITPLLVKEIRKYQIIPYHQNKTLVKTTCNNEVQFFATNLRNLRKIDDLISTIESHPISDFFCFSSPRYITLNLLDCKYKPDKAIQCNNQVWSDITPEVSARYLGVMLDRGGANVDNGIMYLDTLDDTNVLIHELSHFLGFVDEYALPKKHKTCSAIKAVSFSHNIAMLPKVYNGTKAGVLELLKSNVPWFDFIEVNDVYTKIKDKQWQIEPDNRPNKIGLYPAETCSNNEFISYKPVLETTNLQYYEEPFNDIYIHFVKAKPNAFLMPSYHYNVAKALFKNNQVLLGRTWLTKALNKERFITTDKPSAFILNRMRKIKLGHY